MAKATSDVGAGEANSESRVRVFYTYVSGHLKGCTLPRRLNAQARLKADVGGPGVDATQIGLDPPEHLLVRVTASPSPPCLNLQIGQPRKPSSVSGLPRFCNRRSRGSAVSTRPSIRVY